MAIPNSAQTAEVTSTLTGKRGKFSVHEHAHEKIMGVLTNLYEDPEGAVIREYLTNALDSQIEAQSADPNYVWRPVEVTTPSHFNKTYSIRDFGVGMSVADIENVYSQYGYSTKEHTNDQTGMLGLGSKCGLTYTGQFTVIGYKGGVRTRALITLNEDEVPEYVILDTSATDEPNGVEIQVPVRDRNTFAEKTQQFLRWWKPGQVLVNGQEPAVHNYTEVKPGVFLIENTERYYYSAPQSYVIMGNVPYAVDSEYVDQHLTDARLGFAAYVEMGTVDFPPNRERLRYNSRTKAAVAKISEGLFEAILKTKLDEITNASSFKEAWLKKSELEHYFANHAKTKALKYRGYDFPERLAHVHMELDWDWQGHGQIAERQWVNIGLAMRGSLVVTGVTQGSKPTSYFKKKVKHYMEQKNIDSGTALLVEKDIDSVWLAHLPRIDADTIKNLKLPKNPGTTGPRAEAPYDVYDYDGKTVSYDGSQTIIQTAAGKTMVYISPQDMKETYRKSGISAQDFLRLLGKDYQLVVLGKNRFEKFVRNYPNAVKASKVVQDQIDALVNSASNEEYLIGKLSYGEQEFMKSVDVSKIDDPELVKLAKVIQDKNFTANYAKAENLHIMAKRAEIFTKLPEKKNVAGNPVKNYPLLDRVGGRQMKHLIIYINAVYAAEVAPKQP